MSTEGIPQAPRSDEVISAEEWGVLRAAADSGDVETTINEARELGRLGDALNLFRRDNVTENHTVEELLKDAPELSDRDWERLLALWLFDTETAHHSLRTYSLVHRILRARPELVAAIQAEGVELKEEELATILHDLGKLRLPRSVLNNKLSEDEARTLLFEKLHSSDAATLVIAANYFGHSVSTTDVEVALAHKRVRPIFLLPIQYVASEYDIAELRARGFELNDATLMDIINQHERFTGTLIREDHPKESEIAAHHHHPELSRYPASSDLLASTSGLATELVTMVDEIDALTFKRSYKTARPFVEALTHELERYHAGKRSALTTYHVLSVLCEDISEEERTAHPEDIATLNAFIKSVEATEQQTSPNAHLAV